MTSLIDSFLKNTLLTKTYVDITINWYTLNRITCFITTNKQAPYITLFLEKCSLYYSFIHKHHFYVSYLEFFIFSLLEERLLSQAILIEFFWRKKYKINLTECHSADCLTIETTLDAFTRVNECPFNDIRNLYVLNNYINKHMRLAAHDFSKFLHRHRVRLVPE